MVGTVEVDPGLCDQDPQRLFGRSNACRLISLALWLCRSTLSENYLPIGSRVRLICMRKIINRVREQWAFLPAAYANNRLALFVHGYGGSYLGTWGRLPDLLAEHADSYPSFSNWDYLFIGYDTNNVETYLDIAYLICTEWGKAERGDAPFNRPYGRLALFGHSLGTLAIRQLLCAKSIQPSRLINCLHSITLFGAPINGSPLAKFAIFSPIAAALKPKNPQLRMLRQWVEDASGYHPWPAVKVVLGLDDKVVGHTWGGFLKWPGDADVEWTNYDHGALVKPPAWDNSHLIDTIGTVLR